MYICITYCITCNYIPQIPQCSIGNVAAPGDPRVTKWTAALGKNIIANPIFALSASQSLAIIAESRPGNLFRDAGPRWASTNPLNAGKDGFWPTAALSLHFRPYDRVCGMIKNIEKARARPQAATGPYAPARMSTVKTELRVAGGFLQGVHFGLFLRHDHDPSLTNGRNRRSETHRGIRPTLLQLLAKLHSIVY